MTHQLEVDSIQLAFHDRKILSDIYLKCETGKITGLLGRNGEGKSSLLKVIYGTLPCDKSVRIDHVVYPEAFRKADLLLYLPQFNFIPPGLTLKRIFHDFELDYALFEKRFPLLGSNHNALIGNLSGGARRLVEIYTIVKSKSKFALLDEPFTHLNPMQVEEVKEFLLEEKMNKGLLITDHLFEQVIAICDDLILLLKGKTYPVKTLEEIELLGYARIKNY